MNSHNVASPLTFPVDFHDWPHAALVAGTTLEEMIELFGEPTGLYDPGDPGPMKRWAFRYPCGFQLMYQLDLVHNQTNIIADIPEVSHVARHLLFNSSRVTLMPDAHLHKVLEFLLTMFPERKAEFDGLNVAQVRRQGDDGNEFPVGELTSERAAKCHIKELESHRHKQTYWYTVR